MKEKQQSQADDGDEWNDEQVQAALRAAGCHAARFARRCGLSRADREDLSQDILVAIITAHPQFDPARGSWTTFLAVLARRAVADHARRPRPPELLSLESQDAAALAEWLVAPQPDQDVALALIDADQVLPAAPRVLLHRIAAHRDVADARRVGPASTASFYRDLHDLRCWLRALGAAPATACARSA